MTSAIGKILGGGDSKDAPAPAPAPVDKKVEERAGDFAAREQSLGQKAAAAGAQRSDNDADLLGYTLPKKRSAGREILG